MKRKREHGYKMELYFHNYASEAAENWKHQTPPSAAGMTRGCTAAHAIIFFTLFGIEEGSGVCHIIDHPSIYHQWSHLKAKTRQDCGTDSKGNGWCCKWF
jgi:hypothetical protein